MKKLPWKNDGDIVNGIIVGLLVAAVAAWVGIGLGWIG